jgi:uncharacterized membrane protein YgaE (UPF0421/DUF939 family)
MNIRERLERVPGRFDRSVLGRIAQAALAAGIAWEVALQIPGHGQPFFAPIAAVIALGAERGRRGKQAILMMTGVAVGILIGAALVVLVGAGAWQLLLATAIALLLTTAAGASPLVRNQAAASAILVVALHRPGGGNLALQRLVDALIGGALAILLARILFPVDPLALVREQARTVRTQLAAALDDLAAAVASGDRGKAEAALRRIDAVDDSRLQDALALAREVSRAAPRRRSLRRRVEALGTVYRELEASVSDARAIATGALRLIDGGVPSPGAGPAISATATAVRAIDPDEARDRADAARAAARDLRAADVSLGAGVLAHGIAAVADHTVNAAAAREEDARLAAGARNRFSGLHVGKVRRP